MKKKPVGGGGGTLRMALLFGCGILSAPAFVGAEEAAFVSAGTRVRVSTGLEIRMQDFRITTSYMNGRVVVEDKDSLTLELGGRALTLARPNVQLIGTVEASDDETLTLKVGSHANRIVIPRDAIAKLETVLGRRGQARDGAILGGALGISMMASACAGDFVGGCSWGDIGPVATGVGLCAGVGALIGAAIRSDKWVAVPMPSIEVRAQGKRGAGLHISFALRF